MKIPEHLELPAYASTAHKFPKWSCRVTITQEPCLLRRLMPGVAPEIAIHHRDKAQANARECILRASRARKEASAEHGDNGAPNRFPISGGVCEHWPRPVSDFIGGLERLASAWDGVARAWHAYAGKRPGTFPADFSRPGGYPRRQP